MGPGMPAARAASALRRLPALVLAAGLALAPPAPAAEVPRPPDRVVHTDTRGGIEEKAVALEAQTRAFTTLFVESLLTTGIDTLATQAGLDSSQLEGARAALQQKGTFLAAVYIFTLVRLASSHPELSMKELVVQATQVFANRDFWIGLGGYFATQKGLEAVVGLVKDLAIQSAEGTLLQTFAQVGMDIVGSAVAPMALAVIRSLFSGFAVFRDDARRREARGKLIRELHPDEAAELERLAQDYFDRGFWAKTGEAIVHRMDWTLMAVEAAVFLALVHALPVAGAKLAIAGVIARAATGVGIATGAWLTRWWLHETRITGFRPGAARDDLLRKLEGRLEDLGGTPPADLGPEARAARAGEVLRACAGAYDEFLGEVRTHHAAFEREYQTFSEELSGLALQAVGRDRMRAERERLVREVRRNVSPRRADQLLRELPEPFRRKGDAHLRVRLSDRITGEWRETYEGDAVPATIGTGIPREELRGMIEDASRALRAIPGSATSFDAMKATARRLGAPPEVVARAWMAYHRAANALHALIETRAREDASIDALTSATRSPEPYPDHFLTLLDVHRSQLDDQVALEVWRHRQHARLLALEVDPEAVLKAAEDRWTRALAPLARAAKEEVPPPVQRPRSLLERARRIPLIGGAFGGGARVESD